MLKRFFALISAIAVAFVGAISVSLPATAEYIPDGIKSLETSGAARPGQVFTVSGTWAVPDYSQPGDTFSLQLPAPAIVLPPGQGVPLLAPDGETVVAETSYSDDGTIVFILTEYVLDYPLNLHGDFWFHALVTSEAQPGQEYFIVWGDNQQTGFTPQEGVIGDRVFDKFGRITDDGFLRWTIETPMGPFSNATIVDTLGPDQEFICDSLSMATYDIDGENRQTYTGGQVDCTAGVLTITGVDVPADRFLRIAISVDVLPSAGETVYNEASITIDGVTTEDDATSSTIGAGGTGVGENESRFSVTKIVDAPEGYDTSGVDFTVEYRVNDGEWLAFELSGGETWTSGRLVPGDRVELREVGDPSIEGLIFDGAVFSETIVTLVGGQISAIDLTNTYQAPPPTPEIDLRKNEEGDDSYEVEPGTHDVVVVFTNTGEEALQDLVFTDTTQSGADVVWNTDDLAGLEGLVLEPGESYTINGTVEVTLGETHRDTAHITGTGVITGEPVEDEDPTELVPPPADPEVPGPSPTPDPDPDSEPEPDPDPEPEPSTPKVPEEPTLPATGTDVSGLGIAVTLLVSGIIALATTRRRAATS